MDFSLTDEQQRLVDTARKFTRERIIPVAQKLDEHGTFPSEICNDGWALGLMNVEIPTEYGGLGLSCTDHVLMMEEINYGCAGVGTTLAGNNLAAMPLILAGSEEQKKRYLGALTEAPIFAAYACSEPDAGSDVAGMRTNVRGQKRWITNGGYASWYTTFARIGDPKDRHKGITCFVLPRDTPGVSVGKKEDKLGQRASNTTDVLFEDVKLTRANLVGAEGEGFKIAMKTFDRSRPWIAAGATGIMRRALGQRDGGGHGRCPDLRRVRLHQGVPGGKTDAGREAPADLRGHLANPAHGDREEPARPGRLRAPFAGAALRHPGSHILRLTDPVGGSRAPV